MVSGRHLLVSILAILVLPFTAEANPTQSGSSASATSDLELEIPEPLRTTIRSIRYSKLGDVTPTVTIGPFEENRAHVVLTFDLPHAVELDDWRLDVEPAFLPSFHWSPHLTPTDAHIIDQHSFRSPAVLVASKQQGLALVPDLDIMSEATPVRWYLDLDADKNRLSLGMSNYEVPEHVLFVRKDGALYPAGKVEVGFFLFAFSGAESIHNPWRALLAFFWHNWGRHLFESGQPLAGNLSPYVKHTYNWAFSGWATSVWQEFELEGTRVGAPVFIVNQTQSPNYPGEVDEREFRSIWNQAWFSSLRSASGMFVNVLGGFGVMNSDGEWNDSRESLFAEIIIKYGQELGIEEYIQRGLAALRSSFVMMYCPENPKTKLQWEKRHPFFGPEDYGFTMENYGHSSISERQSLYLLRQSPPAPEPRGQEIRKKIADTRDSRV